jgi:hypothetical protein
LGDAIGLHLSVNTLNVVASDYRHVPLGDKSCPRLPLSGPVSDQAS